MKSEAAFYSSSLETVWEKDEGLGDASFYADDEEIRRALPGYRNAIDGAENLTEFLTSEARFTKQLYKYAAQRFNNRHDKKPSPEKAPNLDLMVSFGP